MKLSPNAHSILVGCSALSIFGCSVAAFTALVGFEEADDTLLLASAVLILAAPLALLVHLVLTKQLTRDDKRLWTRAFTSSGFASAFCMYLSSTNLDADTHRLREIGESHES
jgi:hydrogenase-4 membrane subunit HyfE